MEYHLTKNTLRRLRYALDTVTEQPVDIDLTLPDYCPDIERILSCTLIPKLYLVNVSGDRLNVEGGACVRVLYLDAEGGALRCHEHTEPFSDSLPIKGELPDCIASVQAKPEYINCRALSPRKLSLHGAFSLYARAAVADDMTYCGVEDDGDLQMRGEELNVSELCGLCSESFSVQEDIALSGKDEIGALLSHRLQARITELKAIPNKIMLSAELKLELLYLTDAQRHETACLSYSLPVSRVIDCEGAGDEAVIDGELTVMHDDLRLSDDALDGSSMLTLDAKLHFTACCYEEEAITVLSDAFSTERETLVHTEAFSCVGDTVCRSFTDIGKADLAVEDEIGKIIEVHCEKLTASSVLTDGALLLHAKASVGILYENTDGEKRYVERDAEFTYRPDAGGCDEVVRLCAAVESLSYRLTDSRHLELRAEVCYRVTLCCRRSCTAVTAVTADDDAPLRERDGALILYYADRGDSVWDISKRFSSRPQDIIDENALDGDTVDEGMMLLIT